MDGTRKTALKAKLHIDNKSGHKGVRWNEQRQKWTAHIGFKGKQITLGYFSEKADAIAARKAAEEKYHKPYLEDNDETN
ncbi:AP2 domain protein [compost metagenome]